MLRDRHVARQLAKALRIMAVLTEQMVAQFPEEAPADLPKIERAILGALASGEDMPGKRIAKVAGYAMCSSFRAALARMVRQGVLTHGPDGYRLAPKPEPVPARPMPTRLNGTLNGHV
jgi:hypothetical protein